MLKSEDNLTEKKKVTKKKATKKVTKKVVAEKKEEPKKVRKVAVVNPSPRAKDRSGVPSAVNRKDLSDHKEAVLKARKEKAKVYSDVVVDLAEMREKLIALMGTHASSGVRDAILHLGNAVDSVKRAI